MNRHAALHEITGLMGDALAALEADGIALDGRSTRLFVDKFCDLYKGLKEPLSVVSTRALIKSALDDEKLHGGLLSRQTLQLANELKLELGER